jgi:hypothetical protein
MENNAEFVTEQEQLLPVVKLAQLNHIDVANTIINGIIEGNVDPMTTHMFLKRMEKLSETVLADEDVKRITLEAANNSIEKGSSFNYMGAKLTVMAVYTSYDFSACGDPLWDSLDIIEKQIKDMKKERETQLKAFFPEAKAGSLFGSVNPTVIVDHIYSLQQMDCGEEVKLMRPIKYQKTGIKTTFPK